jgi:hypothetical protein
MANNHDVKDLTSHGGGRWFDPSIAHSKCPANAGKVAAPDFRVGAVYYNCTVMTPMVAPYYQFLGGR